MRASPSPDNEASQRDVDEPPPAAPPVSEDEVSPEEAEIEADRERYAGFPCTD